jgi:drug/metabolite transporter, DME family
METEKSTFSPIWLVTFAVLLWSFGGVFIKLSTLDASQITFFRSLLAAITVALLTWKQGLRLNAFGVFTSIIYAALLFLFVWATKHTTAANAIFLQYTAPIYILILSPFLLKEKFQPRDLVTVLLCIGGMSLFFVEQLKIDDYLGNAAALGSGIFLGLYILLLRHPKATGTNPAIAVIYGNLLLAVVNCPFGISAIPLMTFTDVFAVSFLGIIQIGIAYVLFIKGVVRGVRPLDASIIGFLEPILNPVWVYLMIGEKPSNWALLGGFVIILAIALHTKISSNQVVEKKG